MKVKENNETSFGQKRKKPDGVSPNLGHLRTEEKETGGRESELGTSSDKRGRNQMA
ncbi:hypothetical protein NX023_09085 [Cytobacillus firmus]|nr:hypothetical protein [Cytobacillus firmus]